MEQQFRQAVALHQQGRLADAMAAYRQLLVDAPDHPGALYYLGMACLESGDVPKAVNSLKRAFEVEPQRSADAHYALALAHHMNGGREAAVEQYRAALAQDPQHSEARSNLAVVLRELGRFSDAVEAIEGQEDIGDDTQKAMNRANLLVEEGRPQEAELLYRHLLAQQPDNFAVLNNLGGCLLILSRADEALAVLDQAAALRTDSADLWYNRGRVLKHLQRDDEAAAAYEKTLALDPGYFKAWASYAWLEESRHNLEKAAEYAKRAIAAAPDHPENNASHVILAKYHRRLKQPELALNELDRFSVASEATPAIRRMYLFERGAVLDALKRYDEAFAAYREANEATLTHRGERYRYDVASNQDLAERLMRFFSRERVQAMSQLSPPSLPDQPRPIFIVGFPRSGTTLIEQILGAHPEITPGDELPYLNTLVQRCPGLLHSELPYPECLADLARPENHKALAGFKHRYLGAARQAGLPADGQHFFTDKMPLNEWHLGLVRLMFPDSPVIHAVRHPLDSCLSSYFIDMTHGNYGSYRLETVAKHYVLSYRLSEHYQKELGLRFMRVHYEDLVDNFEPRVRQLLDFVGVPFDERCLAFHESKRVARTASYAQVNQKLYTSSQYRYRRYRKHIEPMLPILAPVISELGYDVED